MIDEHPDFVKLSPRTLPPSGKRYFFMIFLLYFIKDDSMPTHAAITINIITGIGFLNIFLYASIITASAAVRIIPLKSSAILSSARTPTAESIR